MPALAYSKCTRTELRGFIISRCRLDPAEAQKLGKARKHALIGRLRALDGNGKFKFGDLPPELRLHVYRYALESGTAVLRASKLTYNEALPVLQEENIVTVSIDHSAERASPSDPVTKDRICRATVIRRQYGNISKRRFFFYVVQEICGVNIRDLKLSSPSFNMFRGVRHVRIGLGRCSYEAQLLIAALCIALSGASQLRKLTIDTERELHDVDDHGKELAGIFQPVALLNANVEIEAARDGAGLQTALNEAHKMLRGHPYRTLRPPGDIIAKAGLLRVRLMFQEHWDFVHDMNTLVLDLMMEICSSVATDNGDPHLAEAWKKLENCVDRHAIITG